MGLRVIISGRFRGKNSEVLQSTTLLISAVTALFSLFSVKLVQRLFESVAPVAEVSNRPYRPLAQPLVIMANQLLPHASQQPQAGQLWVTLLIHSPSAGRMLLCMRVY